MWDLLSIYFLFDIKNCLQMQKYLIKGNDDPNGKHTKKNSSLELSPLSYISLERILSKKHTEGSTLWQRKQIEGNGNYKHRGISNYK